MTKKVLVLDDDTGILEVMQEVLSYAGFQVDAFSDTEDIQQLISVLQPDLLIMDYRLNGKNGGTLCTLVKENPSTAHLPVILYSAYPGVLQAAGQFGCDAFIAKPFDLAELITKVTELTSFVPEAPGTLNMLNP